MSAGPGLRAALDGRKVVVVCGTGGVGKTTTAAALAVDAAMSGSKVLVMTIDPARRLAEALGIDGTCNAATPVDLAGALGVAVPGSLHAMMLDARAAFDGMVERFARDARTRDRILQNRYYQRAAESLSGSQEYMAMEALRQQVVDGGWDLVVLDTPPTRNALDFLDAPDRLLAMLRDGALRWLAPADDGFSAARAALRIFGKGRQAMFSVFERFVGGEVVAGLSEFVGAFATLLDGMGARAAEIMGLLRSDAAGFVLVASPNRLALSEALYFHDRLVSESIPFRGFVINRVQSAPPLATLPESATEAGFPDEPALRGAAEVVWGWHRQRARQAGLDQRHIAALAERCGTDLPYVQIPEQDEPVGDLAALRRLGLLLR